MSYEAMQALADNRWLSDLIDNQRKLLSLSRHKSLVYPGRIQESCAEHLAIFAALQARDPDAAQAVTQRHLICQLDALHAMASQSSDASPDRASIELVSPSHQEPAPE